MERRSLHAVLLSGVADATRLAGPLAAALDGTGPAILPLDAGLPAARLHALLDAFRPDVVVGVAGDATVRSDRRGAAPDTAVVVATSGSTGEPKGVELSGAALLHSARASLARVGALPGERWLCCLPVTHVAGLQVLVRSLAADTEPAVAARADAGALTGSGAAHVSVVPTQLARLLDDPAGAAALAGFSLGAGRRGGFARGTARAGAGRRGAGGDHLRDDRDLRRVRVRRGAAGRRPRAGRR